MIPVMKFPFVCLLNYEFEAKLTGVRQEAKEELERKRDLELRKMERELQANSK